MSKVDSWVRDRRLGGLRRFAVAITLFNLLGHTVFGFEQPWAGPLASLMAAYILELLAEWIDAEISDRSPSFIEGWTPFCNCLLPAHITALAVAMLIYAGDNLLPVMFASAVAIASKATMRLTDKGRLRHFLNPSNFGITVTLLLFPWVGIAPPYHFSENLGPAGSLIAPAVIWISGTILNYRFTGRIPLFLAWAAGFVAQSVVRNLFFGVSIVSALGPMTGIAFALFSFYMVTDPATTPYTVRGQVAFGLAVALVYGALVSLHIVFGFFFALTLISAGRGLILLLQGSSWSASSSAPPLDSAPVPVKAA